MLQLIRLKGSAGISPPGVTPDVKGGVDFPRLDPSRSACGVDADGRSVSHPIDEDATRVDDAPLDGALFQSGRHGIVFQCWDEPCAWGKKVLIARKDTREAARPVHDATPLLAKADAVRVVAV